MQTSSYDKQRIVVKLGTSTLTNGTLYLNHQRVLEVVQQIARLHQSGHDLIIVSSGAQAAGREVLNFPELGRSVPAKQMLSAVGQSHLMRLYNDLFDIFKINVAQILLTREDLSKRIRYLNARDTLLTLIDHRIIPIINENDSIATSEIRVGDNDNLSAMVASVLEADKLIILTDQPGLLTDDPRKNPDAELVQEVKYITQEVMALAGGTTSSGMGTGGMATKLQAAQVATRSGVHTYICSGKEANVLERLMYGEPIGTHFEPVADSLESRKRWLLTDKAQGSIWVDAGAVRALRAKDGASLLPVGITSVEGDFKRSATLSIYGPDGIEIAHGLSNYDSDALRQLCGVKSDRINDILGYSYGDAAVHRNNMVLI